MMLLLALFFEFFKIGLFAVGGGLATIPFLYALSAQKGWFSASQLVDMIALSESTPGPLGVNMATFAGFQTAGIWGGAFATLGLVTPALFVIILISKFLSKFQENIYVKRVFYGLRPAVAGMILFYATDMMNLTLKGREKLSEIALVSGLFLCYLLLIIRFKLHPICFILLGAVMGILLKL